MVRVCALFLVFLLISIVPCRSQSLEPIGFFANDSLKIGVPVAYSLSIRYPESVDINFPDSTYDYESFEFVDKKVFPTYRDSTQLVDSAIYFLRSFEVDPYQKIALPIFLLKKGDSIAIHPSMDSIPLVEMIPQITGNEKVKSSTKFVEVTRAFNYPLLSIILGGLAILAVLALIIFGKRIRTHFTLKKLKKEYVKFSDDFSSLIANISRDKNLKRVEETLVSWKSYLEKLEHKPYMKSTTKEITGFGLGETLTDSLRSIDRSIYRNEYEDGLRKSFEYLEDIALERYKVKLEEVKNA